VDILNTLDFIILVENFTKPIGKIIYAVLVFDSEFNKLLQAIILIYLISRFQVLFQQRQLLRSKIVSG